MNKEKIIFEWATRTVPVAHPAARTLVVRKIAAIFTAALILLLPFAGTAAYAQSSGEKISADVYEFEKDNSYTFSTGNKSTAAATGTLTVSGADYTAEYTAGNDGGMVEFAIDKDYADQDTDYNLSFSYSYSDSLLSAADDQWHLVSDGDQKVDSITLDEKIGKGALIVQVSRNGSIWVNAYTATNIFEENPKGISDFYRTSDVQLTSGCYYRVIVAYEVAKKTASSKILFWEKDNYDTKKYVEVYRLRAYDAAAGETDLDEDSPKYNLGSRVRTAEFDGYYGEKDMDKDDPHYGWDLGQFFVSGYTDTSLDSSGNVVFLKNTGDQISLWFNLQQNLDCLNGNSKITIEPDEAGYDKYFETPTTDFGYGALIIRKINSENVKETAQIYTDYLLASATPGADTQVSLFEEGDYEVALDYAIKNDKTVVFGRSILPGESHYRIYFKFSVRNSNSMFFIRDLENGSELTNNAIAPNGFYLDLAGSKYLHLSYVREVLNQNTDSLSEDVRENKAAKDGDRFTKAGIYTITVTNTATNKETTKRIYVGDDEVLKAYMKTGLSIREIRDRIANGSTIDEAGNIIDPVVVEVEASAEKEEEIEAGNAGEKGSGTDQAGTAGNGAGENGTGENGSTGAGENGTSGNAGTGSEDAGFSDSETSDQAESTADQNSSGGQSAIKLPLILGAVIVLLIIIILGVSAKKKGLLDIVRRR